MPVEPATCCSATVCDYAKEGEPCWGRLEVVWEDLETFEWVHACTGHHDVAVYHNAQYRRPPDAC